MSNKKQRSLEDPKDRTIKGFVSRVEGTLQPSVDYFTNIFTPLIAVKPEWGVPIMAAIGLWRVRMASNQNRINEMVEFIADNPSEFRKSIVESEEFKDGFTVFMGDYLEQRIQRKREALKTIFLGFSASPNKEEFELERLNDCISRMSLNALECLVLIKQEIISGVLKQVEEQIGDVSRSDRSEEWWIDHTITTLSIWQPVDIWLRDNFDTKQTKVKEKFGVKKTEGWPADLERRAKNQERDERAKKHEALTELVTLGILNRKTQTGVIGGGGADYFLTIFGWKLLKTEIIN